MKANFPNCGHARSPENTGKWQRKTGKHIGQSVEECKTCKEMRRGASYEDLKREERMAKYRKGSGQIAGPTWRHQIARDTLARNEVDKVKAGIK